MKFQRIICLCLAIIWICGRALSATQIAGVQTIGTPELPDLALTSAGYIPLDAEFPRAMVFDSQKKYLYIVTGDQRPRVLKLDTSGGFYPVQLAELRLNVDERSTAVMLLDPAGAYIYLGLSGASSRLLKIRTSDLVRISSLDFGVAFPVTGGAMDPAGTYGYISVYGIPALVEKINLSNMTIAATLSLNSNETNSYALAIDHAGQFLYAGTTNSPASVIKINLATFTRQATIVLPVDEYVLYVALIDPMDTYLYFGCNVGGGPIIKIRLSDFKRIGSVGLSAKTATIWSGIMDPNGYYAYFGVFNSGSTARIEKLDLTTFLISDEKELPNSTGAYPFCGAINGNGTIAYFGTEGIDPAALYYVNLAAFSPVSNFYFARQMQQPRAFVTDAEGRDGFCFDYPNPDALLAQIDLVSGSRTRTVTLPSGITPTQLLVGPNKDFLYMAISPALDQPATILKISRATLQIEQSASLASDETFSFYGIIEPSGRYAFLETTLNGKGFYKIVRFDLQAMQRVDSFTLGSRISGAAMDPSGEYGYFVSPGPPAVISRIRLSDFSSGGSLQLPADDVANYCAIDPLGRFLYCFGTRASSPGLTKINLSTFSRVSKLSDPGLGSLSGGLIDSSGQFAYLTTYIETRMDIAKVNVADMTLAGTVPISSDKIIADPQGNYLYGTAQSSIERISLNSRGAIRGTRITLPKKAQISTVAMYSHQAIGMRRMDATRFTWGAGSPQSAVRDAANNCAYFGLQGSPGKVARFDLNSLQQTGTLTFSDSAAIDPACALIDPSAQYAYFGCFSGPGKVVKINLSDFTEAGTLTFAPGENNIACGAIDASGSFAYFGCNTDPPQVVKVRLSDFTRIASTPLQSGEGPLRTAFVAGKKVYFGAYTSPGKVIRVDLASFTRDGMLALAPTEYLLHSAVVDSTGTYAYFGTSSAPGIVVKVQLSNFSRVGAIEMNKDEDDLACAVIDPSNTFAIFGMVDGSVRVDLPTFTRTDGTKFLPTDGAPVSAVMDSTGTNVWFGTQGIPARAVKVQVSPKPLRMAIYKPDSNFLQFTRLWQSGAATVPQAKAFRTLSISTGTPNSLVLEPGDYYLAWQLDTELITASHLTNGASAGLFMSNPFGPFPARSYSSVSTNTDQWTSYLTYTPQSAARHWIGYR